jgi:Uncharacterised nucleotidyltransferase
MSGDRYPFLPTVEEELLLKACLTQGEEALRSWRTWRDSVDIEDIDVGTQRLLPLLYDNLRTLGVNDPILSRYKSVYRYFWLQNQLQTRQAVEVLELLAAAGIEGMLLKGTAFIALYYRRYGLRPMDDVDVLVRPERIEYAIDVLRNAGWRLKQTLHWMISHRSPAVHLERGPFELDLHRRVFQDEFSGDEFWFDGQSVAVLGKPTKTLSDTGHLLHTCLHGARWNEVSPVRWVADAAFILRQASIDWPRLLGATRALGVKLAVRETLAYLERTLPGSVPTHFLLELERMPVTRGDKLEFQGRVSQIETQGLGLVLARYYGQFARTAQGGVSPLEFFRNVQSAWEVTTITGTFLAGMRRLVRFLRRRSVSSKQRRSGPRPASRGRIGPASTALERRPEPRAPQS